MRYDDERFEMWTNIQEMMDKLCVAIIQMNEDIPQDVMTYVNMVQDDLVVRTIEHLLCRQELFLLEQTQPSIGEEE